MAVHQPPVRHGDRPEPLRRGARRVRRHRLAAAGHAGPAQRQPAAAVELLMIRLPFRGERFVVESLALTAMLIAAPGMAAGAGAGTDEAPDVAAVKAAFL